MARQDDLEHQLRMDPDDDDAYLVLADTLQTSGDPRGRLIVVQHQLERDRRIELLVEEHALLEAHRATLLGDFARYEMLVVWRSGFPTNVCVGDDHKTSADAAEVLAALLRVPHVAMLRTLEISTCREPRAAIELLVANAALLPNLCSLYIGDLEEPSARALTGHPTLRELSLVTAGLLSTDVRSLANASWPRLERLELWLGSGGATIEDLEPLLAARGVPKLRHLGLRNAVIGDQLCVALVRSRLASQLESLDLSTGMLTDAGAQTLAAARHAFPALRVLSVHDNLLSPAGYRVLQSLLL